MDEIKNRVWNLDCLDGMSLLEDGCCDLGIVDPPYGIDFSTNHRKETKLRTAGGIANDKDNKDFLESVAKSLFRVLKDGCHLYWFTRWDKVGEHGSILESCGFTWKNCLIWVKNNWSMGDLAGAYAGQYENILFVSKGSRELNEIDGIKRHSDVLRFDRIDPLKLLHSHQKPTALLEFLIRKSSNKGDMVCVPFGGSGSECVAAQTMGRDFVSFELDQYYVDLANKRIEQAAQRGRLIE